MTTIAVVLSQRLAATGDSRTTWAKRHGFVVDTLDSYCMGRAFPSHKMTLRLLQALHLEGDERERFLAAATADRARNQSRAKPLVGQLEAEVAQLRQAIAQKDAQLAEFGALCDRAICELDRLSPPAAQALRAQMKSLRKLPVL
jgi:hypothetical protein